MAAAAPTQILLEARRVAIVGAPGSGKTTFARQLQPALELPLFHLDDIYWLRGWKRVAADSFEASQSAIVDLEEWIIDGNHLPTFHIRLSRADVICLMDVSTFRALGGFFVRAYRRAIGDRSSLPHDVRSDKNWKWRPGFDLKTLRTLLFFHLRIRPKLLELISSKTSTRIVVLKNWHDSEQLVAQIALIRKAGSS